jgi:hypothetical protein
MTPVYVGGEDVHNRIDSVQLFDRRLNTSTATCLPAIAAVDQYAVLNDDWLL